MTGPNHPDSLLATEPDQPELSTATRFILAVTVFVVASLIGLRAWLGDQIEPPPEPPQTMQR